MRIENTLTLSHDIDHPALLTLDEDRTLRAYGSKTDAYLMFRGMLESGHPPDDFATLMKEVLAAAEQFEEGLKAAPGL